MRPTLQDENRIGVLHRIRREAVRIARRLHATEPVPVFATTNDRLVATTSLADAVEHVAWASLIVEGDEPIATVEVEAREHRVATTFGHIPRAVASAVKVAERGAEHSFSIQDIAIVKIGQIGVIAIWIRSASLLVPIRLRSNRREIEPNRQYTEASFISAVAAAATRISMRTE